jgi:hypothetical protein
MIDQSSPAPHADAGIPAPSAIADSLSVFEWRLCVEGESTQFIAALTAEFVRAGQSAQDARANAEAQRVSQLLSEYRDSLVELGLRNEIAVVAVRQVAQQPARDRRPYAESAVAVTRALPGAGAGAIAAAIASVHAEFPEVAAS